MQVSSEKGVALVVSLMMLIVILILGLSALRISLNSERTTGYATDRHIAFQAAEAALRELEDRVANEKPIAPNVCGISTGASGNPIAICPTPVVSAAPRWVVVNPAEWANATPVGQLTPTYLVEHLGSTFDCNANAGQQGCSQYRITVRAGNAPRSQVTLQSIYLTD
jgi:type IV pilus assembly protein PilX